MNNPTPHLHADPDVTRWGLMALALVVGMFLMVYYVNLLQDSVARGAQRRYSQVTGVQTAATKSAPMRAQLLSAER